MVPLRCALARDMDLLTSRPWTITFGGGRKVTRVFDKNGTYSTPGSAEQLGNWKITSDAVIQTYADGGKDMFILPLDPNGTVGVARDGGP